MFVSYPRVHAYAVGQGGSGKRGGMDRASVGVQAKRYCVGYQSHGAAALRFPLTSVRDPRGRAALDTRRTPSVWMRPFDLKCVVAVSYSPTTYRLQYHRRCRA